MSKIAHTPGPWEIQDPMGEDLWIVQAGLEAFEWTRIASVATDDSEDAMDRGASRPISKRERAANARLIAAAPDLLAALKAMVLNDQHTYRDCHKAAVAAISKAQA